MFTKIVYSIIYYITLEKLLNLTGTVGTVFLACSLMDDILQVVVIFLHPKIDTLFFALFWDCQIRVSDSKLDISITVNENGTSIYENLSLDVDNQKQTKF